jgi:hypothetical protein
MFVLPVSPLSFQIAQLSIYGENTSRVIVDVPLSVTIGVVVSIVNVAPVLLPAESVTTNIFVPSLVIGSPLLYAHPLIVAVAQILSVNVMITPVL